MVHFCIKYPTSFVKLQINVFTQVHSRIAWMEMVFVFQNIDPFLKFLPHFFLKIADHG